MKPTIEKIRILLKATTVFKNWWLYPLVYLKLTKHPTVIFETKKGFKIFNDINKSVGEYLDIIQHIHSPKIVKLHKKLQTKLKNFNK